MSDAIIVALIGGAVTLTGMLGRAVYVLYPAWQHRRQAKRTLEAEVRQAKDVRIAALEAELKAQKSIVRYLRRALKQCYEGREP